MRGAWGGFFAAALLVLVAANGLLHLASRAGSGAEAPVAGDQVSAFPHLQLALPFSSRLSFPQPSTTIPPNPQGGPSSASPGPRPDNPPPNVDVPVATGTNVQSHPSIVGIANGSLLVVAYENETSPGNRDVYAARSTDGGASWSQVVVSANPTYNEFEPRIVAHGSRLVIFFSVDDPALPFGFRYAVSADQGRLWIKNQVNFGSSSPVRDFRRPDAQSANGQWIHAGYDVLCISSSLCGTNLNLRAPIAILLDSNATVVAPSIFFPFGYDTVALTMAVGPTWTVMAADVDASQLPGGFAGARDVVFWHTRTGQNSGTSWMDFRVTGFPSTSAVRVDGAAYGVNHTLAYQFVNAGQGFPDPIIIGLVNNNDTNVSDWQLVTVAAGSGMSYSDAAIAAGNGSYFVTFSTGASGNLGYTSSLDGGTTWRSVVPLNDHLGSVLGGVRASDVAFSGGVRAAWEDDRNGNPDIFFGGFDGPGPDHAPRPPVALDAQLTGAGLADVTLTWSLSPDDGSLENDVVAYDLYGSPTYDRTGASYTLLGTVPAGSTSYVHASSGASDPASHFYRVLARDRTSHTTFATQQFGKHAAFLAAGPHLVSLPLYVSDRRVGSVLQTVDFDTVRSFVNPPVQGRNWLSFHRKGPAGDLGTMDGSHAFWVSVNSDSEFAVAGLVPAQTSTSLAAGWNLVGYSSFVSRTVAAALAGAPVQVVEGFDGAQSPYFLVRLAGTDTMAAGAGFWLRLSAPFAWTLGN